MNRIRLRQCKFEIKNIFIIIIVLIVFITSIMISTIGKKASTDMIYISRNIINTINTNTVNGNIRIDLLKNYNMNDLIKVNYEGNKITDIDYNLENAYEILIAIKKEIIKNIEVEMPNIYNYRYVVNNNTVIVEMPFYNYTHNILIANLGPKIMVQLSMIRLIDGSVKTKIKNYGINSLLLELYINFSITSTIVVPNAKEMDITSSYDILISSKVIQGEIPSLYNGLLEQSSELINA